MGINKLDRLREEVISAVNKSSRLVASDYQLEALLEKIANYQEEVDAQRQELSDSQSRIKDLADKFSMLFELSPIAYMIVDKRGNLLQYNQQANKLFSLVEAVRVGSPAALFIDHIETRKEFRRWLLHGKDVSIDLKVSKENCEWVTVSCIDLENTYEKQSLLAFSDISDRMAAAKLLEARANYDALTGLPNRHLTEELLIQQMSRAKRQGLNAILIFIDLDGFKLVNDKWGHEVGDKLLQTVAQSMKRVLRNEDVLGRYGGDEFLLIVTDECQCEDEMTLCNKILETVSGVDSIFGHPVSISASLGLTSYPQATDITAEHMIKQADTAMYQAKRAGKNRFRIYDFEQNNSLESFHQLSLAAKRGLVLEQFIINYQPKVGLANKQIIGFEALLRWQHPTLGLISPSEFQSLFEHKKIACQIDRYVLNKVLHDMQQWLASGMLFDVNINISGAYLQYAHFVDEVEIAFLNHPDVSPKQVTFEITEIHILNNLHDVADTIRRCQRLGIQFSLDDFGTGYSSLTHLQQLPIKELKIDKSFIKEMCTADASLELIKGIVGLSKAFNVTCVAEGVETKEQLGTLGDIGCDSAQGFLFSEALPKNQVVNWFKSH